ncbi:HTH-type transcriptional regulator CdhR [Roseovarius albus]|uniref:HTH-type transcriptional regulator CdhR n=1 Tax=Roseovarius albus TaxID=1247867 RepID=A0A1X7A5Z0_9RHOB|nr:helix-turn-helix domain-containing protein [Roseovarius albus]SLN69609.1 HTH-type transcriptional regulator CdhR [Roseovarius albus]
MRPTNTEVPKAQQAKSSPPYDFQFVLAPGYSMLSLVTALETLQNANLCAGRQIYSWSLYSVSNNPDSSLSDLQFPCSPLAKCIEPNDIVIVGGASVSCLSNKTLNVWLSRYARGDVRVTGLMTGSIVMAETGLINDVPVTLHWQYRDMFAEIYTDAELSSRPYLSAANRCSSSGGVSAIDLFLDFIQQTHGEKFSANVAESMNYVTIRQNHQIATAEASARQRIGNPHIRVALKIMEENLEHPVSPKEIARESGVSVRQVERLFSRYLGKSPSAYYMQLRLRRAYFLLTQSELSIADISLACGFNNLSHFSKCFRNEFGHSPKNALEERVSPR